MDVNFWRLTPLFKDKFKNPCFSPVPIGEIINLAQYGISELASSSEVGVPILRMNNLQNDGWDFSDLKYIELGNEQLERYSLEKGDILFNRTNSKELVGKCEVFDQDGFWVFASYLIRVRVKNDIVIPQFVSDFLSTETGRLQIDRVSRQIIGMTNINAEEIRQIIIPFPPLEFQKSLISKMDLARRSRQSKIEQAEELLKGLDEYILAKLSFTLPTKYNGSNYAITKAILERRIDSYSNQPHFRELFKRLSQSKYKVLTIKSFSNKIISGSTPLSGGDAYTQPPNGIRFIRSGEITSDGSVTPKSENHIKEEIHYNSLQRSQLKKNDVLIAIVGATIGQVGVYEFEEEANINQAIAAVSISETKVLPHYLCWYLKSSLGQMILDYFKRPVARANINLDEIAQIPVIVPPKEIQLEIINEVTRRKSESNKLKSEAETEWQNAKKWFEEQLLK